MPFPYMSIKITSLMLWIGILLATLNILILAAITGTNGLLIYSLIRFIGVFIVGWSLISFGYAKILPAQKSIALFFAAAILVGLFNVLVAFTLNIA